MTISRQHSSAIYRLIILCFILFIYTNIQAAIIYVVNSESRTLSRIDTDTDQVQNAFATLGIIPNKIISAGGFLWCVNSGDNAVQKISPQTGSTITNILIESSCNPWDACYDSGFLYVTGLFTNKVYKVNTQNNSVENSLAVGNSPEALCTYNGKLYVTNTGGYQNNYANSSVSVIDLDTFSVIKTIPVSANPQYIVEKDGRLHVSCTGNWTDVFGKVCIINPDTDSLLQTLDIGGSLGSIWVKNTEQAFAADGNGLNLFQYNPESYAIINDGSNPLTPGGSVVWGDNQLIAILSPNWGGNGKIRILYPDLNFWKEYTIGLTPTDMKFFAQPTPVTDETALPVQQIKVYPNPLKARQDITFDLCGKPLKKRGYYSATSINIYNAKGQIILSKAIRSNSIVISGKDLMAKHGNGVYYYRIQSGKDSYQGKFIFID